VRWLVLAGLLAGCTSSSANDGGAALGEPCSHTQPCNSDGVCDYEAIYEAVGSAGQVCIDKDADPDNDGLPNSIDHCPDTPGGLYDEDNDGIGDECDHCPIAPPPATPDLDNDDDGIPDKIDKCPNTKGEPEADGDAGLDSVYAGLRAAAGVGDSQIGTLTPIPPHVFQRVRKPCGFSGLRMAHF